LAKVIKGPFSICLGLYWAGLGDFSVLILALPFYLPIIPNLFDRFDKNRKYLTTWSIVLARTRIFVDIMFAFFIRSNPM